MSADTLWTIVLVLGCFAVGVVTGVTLVAWTELPRRAEPGRHTRGVNHVDGFEHVTNVRPGPYDQANEPILPPRPDTFSIDWDLDI